MSAKILTFGNFKGGTGKTTNSTMIGFELSNRNKKVLLLDLDPQGNATNLYLKTKSTLDGEVVIFNTTLMSAIKNENLSSAIINIKENLDVLPSATDFSLFPRYMEFLPNYEDRVRYLSTLIEPLRNKYDYIRQIARIIRTPHVSERLFVVIAS
ncbi:ParA family protein [Leuconostoc falkenbergense]|uniref:ParA family protein n=1 Tax=Leuconostoc falkenbergense TaxID=2766470 RepID=UPI001FC8848B|nr:AAA family ATPase [Leuconostoc falkenbergense]